MLNKKFRLYSLIIMMAFLMSVVSPQPAEAGIFDFAKDMAGKVVDKTKEVVSGTVDTVKDMAAKAYETAKDAIKGVVSSLTGMGKEVASTAKETVSAAKDTAEKAAGAVTGAQKEFADKVNASVTNAVKNVENYIKGKDKDYKQFTGMISDMKDQGINFVEKIKEDMSDKAEDILHPALSKLKQEAESATKDVKMDVKQVASVLGDKSTKGFDLTKDYLSTFFDKGKNSISIAKALGTSNFKSNDGSLSASLKTSLFSANAKAISDIEGHAKGEISAHESLASIDASVGPRLTADFNGKLFGDKVNITAKTDNVLGAWGKANGNVKFMKDGALFDAKAKAEVGVGFKSENEAQITTNIAGGVGTKSSIKVEAMAGAQARANGTAYVGKNGIELSGKAEARCGAWVEGNFNNAVQYKGKDLFGFGGGGGVGAGVGAGVQGGFSFRTDKIGFEKVGFTLGPIKVNGSFYVNPVGIAEAAVDKGKEVLDKGKQVVDNIADKGKKLLSKLNPFD